MAVQAQYRSNVLFFNNDEREREQEQENNNNQLHRHQHQHQQPPLFFSAANGDGTKNNNKKKKRGREAQAQNAFPLRPLQPSAPSMISVSQLHHQPPPPVVSTGLRLSPFDNPTTNTSSSFSMDNNDLFAQINHHHTQQLNHFLLAQGEQLRLTLAEKRQQHLHALLAAAEDSAASKLAEKQTEVDRAARRTAELEERLARLRTESMAWQAKAAAEQSAAALLHAQLQSAAAGPEDCGGDRAEDAESAHVDPERAGVCRCCRVEPVSVVLLPCRHLCLCAGCDAVTAGERCPVCRGARTGGVQVFFS